MSLKRVLLATTFAAAGLFTLTPLFGVSPSFKPDVPVKGSALTGWHTLGQATWKAQNGEITGTGKAGGQGGWLVLDHSYQDAAFYSSFRCGEGCKTGVLLRAEKTPQGMKGVFVSLDTEGVGLYRVTLDAEGRELTRDRLPYAGGMTRIAPPPDPNAPARGGRGGGRRREQCGWRDL
jgi:hypothetical protein